MPMDVVELRYTGSLACGRRRFSAARSSPGWDLGTFWPRAVHPFAPPCYAERAVPELARRVTALTRNGDVVLSGHSQGSVLAAAAILQLPGQTLRRVAPPTYGSPLRAEAIRKLVQLYR